jgi:hypothetical protein
MDEDGLKKPVLTNRRTLACLETAARSGEV